MSFKSKLAKLAIGVDNFITGGSGVRWFINSKIKEYGEVLEINLELKHCKLLIYCEFTV